MKLGTTVGLRDDPDALAARVKRLEDAGVEYLWTGEAYSADAVSTMGFLAAVTKTAQIGSSILPLVLAHSHSPGHDGGRRRQAVEGPLHPGPRRVRSPGDRGVPRCALRRAACPHPRDHRDLPVGVAARPSGARGRQLPGAVARGAGHRARQGAQDHGPPRPRADPHLRRLARAEERRDDGGAGRGVAPAALLARAGPRAVGPLARGRRGRAGGGPAAAPDRRRRVARHRGRRRAPA